MKKMRKILATMLAMVFVLAMLSACGGDQKADADKPAESNKPAASQGGTEQKDEKDEAKENEIPLNEDGTLIEGYDYGFNFAYIVSYTPAEFFQNTQAIFEEELAKYGCTLELLGDAVDGSVEAEIGIIENAIASKKYDALFVYPADIQALTPICKEASAQGVPVIAYGVSADDGMGDVHFNIDNFEVGGVIAEMAIDWVYANSDHFGDEVEICIQRNTSNTELAKRGEGSIARIKEENAKGGVQFKIVMEKEAGSYEEGMDLAENLHVAQPNCEIIIGHADDPMVGAAEAWAAMGKDTTYCGTFGMDATALGYATIANPDRCFRGTVNQSVEAQPPIVADGLIKIALGVLEEGDMPSPPLLKVTEDNIADFYTEG